MAQALTGLRGDTETLVAAKAVCTFLLEDGLHKTVSSLLSLDSRVDVLVDDRGG